MKETLVQVAWAAARSKKSYFSAYYHRLKARIGPKKAIIAVARRIAVCIYWVLRRRQKYYDLGANFVDKNSVARKLSYHKMKVQELETTILHNI